MKSRNDKLYEPKQNLVCFRVRCFYLWPEEHLLNTISSHFWSYLRVWTLYIFMYVINESEMKFRFFSECVPYKL